VQQILGFALTPDDSVHEQADFEYTVRSSPGWRCTAALGDTDRLIIARQLGWRPSQKRQPSRRNTFKPFKQFKPYKLTEQDSGSRNRATRKWD
jgi:hypothetical protein